MWVHHHHNSQTSFPHLAPAYHASLQRPRQQHSHSYHPLNNAPLNNSSNNTPINNSGTLGGADVINNSNAAFIGSFRSSNSLNINNKDDGGAGGGSSRMFFRHYNNDIFGRRRGANNNNNDDGEDDDDDDDNDDDDETTTGVATTSLSAPATPLASGGGVIIGGGSDVDCETRRAVFYAEGGGGASGWRRWSQEEGDGGIEMRPVLPTASDSLPLFTPQQLAKLLSDSNLSRHNNKDHANSSNIDCSGNSQNANFISQTYHNDLSGGGQSGKIMSRGYDDFRLGKSGHDKNVTVSNKSTSTLKSGGCGVGGGGGGVGGGGGAFGMSSSYHALSARCGGAAEDMIHGELSPFTDGWHANHCPF